MRIKYFNFGINFEDLIYIFENVIYIVADLND